MINDFIAKLIIILVPALVLLYTIGIFICWIIKSGPPRVNIFKEVLASFWLRYKLSIILISLFFLGFLAYKWTSFAFIFLIGALLTMDVVMVSKLVESKSRLDLETVRKKGRFYDMLFINSFMASFYIISAELLTISVLYFVTHNVVSLIAFILGVSMVALPIYLRGDIENHVKISIDFFETFILVIIAAMLLGFFKRLGEGQEVLIIFPLLLVSLALFSAVVNFLLIWFLKFIFSKYKRNEKLFYGWILGSAAMSLILFLPAISYLLSSISIGYKFFSIFYPLLLGLIAAVLIFFIAKHYDSKKSELIKSIVKFTKADFLKGVLATISIGAKSTFLLMMVVIALIWGSYQILNFYGIALTAISIISLLAVVLLISIYNSLSNITRESETVLFKDTESNKYMNKAYSVFATIFSVLLIFAVYIKGLTEITDKFFIFDLAYLQVLIGLFLGGMFVYIFTAYILENIAEEKENLLRILFLLFLPFLFMITILFISGPRGLGGMIVGVIVIGSYLVISLGFSRDIWEKARTSFGDVEQEVVSGRDIIPSLNSMIKVIGVLALVAMLFL